jgi:hypothetical protein
MLQQVLPQRIDERLASARQAPGNAAAPLDLLQSTIKGWLDIWPISSCSRLRTAILPIQTI